MESIVMTWHLVSRHFPSPQDGSWKLSWGERAAADFILRDVLGRFLRVWAVSIGVPEESPTPGATNRQIVDASVAEARKRRVPIRAEWVPDFVEELEATKRKDGPSVLHSIDRIVGSAITRMRSSDGPYMYVSSHKEPAQAGYYEYDRAVLTSGGSAYKTLGMPAGKFLHACRKAQMDDEAAWELASHLVGRKL